MSVKLLVNGISGSGKTSLIADLEDAFVVSRDGKEFPYNIPHMMIDTYHDMGTVIHGGMVTTDDEEVEVEGVYQKLEKYNDKYGKYPRTIVIDSVSKLTQDAIDYANLNFSGFDVFSCINKEVAILTNFIQEDLVAGGLNVVLINHVMDNDKKGLVPIGQGKFKDKGGFYSEVDHSILIGDMKVTHRGIKNQARTTINELPDTQHVANTITPSKSRKLKDGESYYSLQTHVEMIEKLHNTNQEWKL